MDVTMQPRSAQRFGLALPVTMDGQPCACHDLSATGVLLETSQPPALGARVALDLQYEADGRGRSVPCTGRVVRVERHGTSWNVAVALDEPLFTDVEPQEGGTG